MYSEYSRLFWDNWCRKSSNNFLRQIVGVGCSVLSLYSFNEIHVWLLLLKINFLSENNSGEIFAHWKRKCLLTGPPSHHIKKQIMGKKGLESVTIAIVYYLIETVVIVANVR